MEDLGFSRKEFDGAMKKIGYKKSKKNREKHSAPVEYWTDPSRLTFYTIHEKNLYELLFRIYREPSVETEAEAAKAAESAPEVVHPGLTPQAELSEKPSDNAPDSSELSVKPKRDVTKSPKGDLVKPKRDVTKSPKGALDLKSKRDVTKSPKGDFSSSETTSEKEITSEREDALALFSENFPTVTLNNTKQADIRKTVTNEDAWKYTLWWWKFKEYRADRTDNMLDFYLKKAVPKLAQARTQEQEPQPQESLFAPGKPDNGRGHLSGVWKSVLKSLEQRINGPSFNTWLRPTYLRGQHEQTVQIGVPDDVFVYWLQEYYQALIIEILAERLGFQPQLEFVVQDSE
jgi:hypothetical protein